MQALGRHRLLCAHRHGPFGVSRWSTEAERWLALRGVGEAWLLTGGEPGLRAPGFYAARGWRATGREADGQIGFSKRLAPGRA